MLRQDHSRLGWALNSMTSILREEERIHTDTKRKAMWRQAEMGVMQHKPRLLGATRSCEEETGFPPRPSEKLQPW